MDEYQEMITALRGDEPTKRDLIAMAAAERGLLDRLQSLKVLLGTDAPEVRGWAPAVQQGAQATVNATIAELKRLYRLDDARKADGHGAGRA